MSASAGASRARAPFTPRRVSRVAARPRVSARRAERVPASQLGTRTNRRRRGRRLGGAAWRLAKHGFDVTLLDASPNPGGLSQGWRTANGRAVEAGCKGFWRHYKNIDALCAELRIDPFTLYTSSAFYGPKGRETEALPGDLPASPRPSAAPPVHLPYFRNLSLEDRLSGAPPRRPPSLRRRRRRLPSLRRAKRPRRLPRRRRFESHRWRQSSPLRRVPSPPCSAR